MRFIFLFLLHPWVSWAVPSSAQKLPLSCQSKSIQQVNFQAVADLAQKLDFAGAILDIEVANKERCSAAIVSDSGLIMTARHCLNTCFEYADQTNTNFGHYDEHGRLTCPFWVHGREYQMHVRTTSKCSSDEIFNQTQDSSSAKSSPCMNQDEVAILEPEPALDDVQCLPLNLTRPAIGTAVGTLGFPATTHRTTGDNAEEYSLFWSKGKVVSSPTCQLKLKQNGQIVTKTLSLKKYAAYSSVLIQTTVDINVGNSGGPLINAEGEVVGLASVLISGDGEDADAKDYHDLQNSLQECDGATFFSPLNHLAKMARTSGDLKLMNELKCQKHRASSTPSVAP